MISLKRTVSFMDEQDIIDILFVCNVKGCTFTEFARNSMKAEVKRCLRRMVEDRHNELHVKITPDELHKLIGIGK